MNKYLVLTSDGQTVKVLATAAAIRDGALCFYGGENLREQFVISYAPGAWKFFGLADHNGDIPNIEAD